MNHFEDVRFIVADMDGTLLDDNKQVDSHMQDVLKALAKKKILFTLASGRNVHVLSSYIEELQIALPYIANNGASVFQNKLCVYEKHMEVEDLTYALMLLEKEQIAFLAYTQKGLYIGKEEHEQLAIFMQRLKGKTKQYRGVSIADIVRHRIVKIVIASDHVNRMQMAMQCIRLHGKNLCCEQSEDRIYTITHVDATKGKTLEKIMEILHIQANEVLVFGDHVNDISMFEIAGYSVAMANSVPEAKAKANFRTFSNNANGVSAFINTYILKQDT